MEYKVKPVVCDYGIFECTDKGEELVFILNSSRNAELIARILNADKKHEVYRVSNQEVACFEVGEICPHCEREVQMVWDVRADAYKAYCPYCGKVMMLCGECLHPTEDNPDQSRYCDWHEGKCRRWKQ